jgi:hypothetical protein
MTQAVEAKIYEPSSSFVPYSIHIIVSSYSNDDIEVENPPLHDHLPPNESIENETTLTPLLPKWVCSTRELNSDLVGDPSDWHQTCS